MGKNNQVTTRLGLWDYEGSVKAAKKHLAALQKSNLELVRELYIAKKNLLNPGYRSDRTSGNFARGLQMAPRIEGFGGQSSECMPQYPEVMPVAYYTWENYCEAIGLAKRTADHWLSLYDPEEDRLLTVEEFKARRILEFKELIKQLEASVGKPIDWRPEGWSTACENYYKDKLKDRKLIEIAQRDHFDQLELFNQEYLNSLVGRFDAASPEEILEFGRLCEDLKPYAVKAVPVQKQARVVKLVEVALAEFQPAVRADVARFVAETIMRREIW